MVGADAAAASVCSTSSAPGRSPPGPAAGAGASRRIGDRVGDQRAERRPAGRHPLAADRAVDEHEVRRAGHRVVLPRLRGHDHRHAGRGQLAQRAGPLAVGAVGDDDRLHPGGQPASRSAAQKPAQVVQPLERKASSVGAAGGGRSRARPRRRPGVVPAIGGAGRPAAVRAATAAAPGRGSAERPSAPGGPEPAQDLGVAAQQARDEHDAGAPAGPSPPRRSRSPSRPSLRRAPGPPAPSGSPPRARRCCCRPSRCALQLQPGHLRRGAGRSPAGRRPRSRPAPGCCTARSGSGCSPRGARCSRRWRTGSRRGTCVPGDAVAVEVVPVALVAAQARAAVVGALPPAGDVRARPGSGCCRARSRSRTPCSRPGSASPGGQSPGRITAQAVPGRTR